MIVTHLVNHGYAIYEGDSLYDAMEKAEKSGFEAAVYNSFDQTTLSFSPIRDWKFI